MRKLKLFSLLLLLFIGVGQMWATTTTYQHVFNAKPSIGNDVTLSDLKWNIAATNLGNYNSGNYAGVQVGSSKANGSIALTSASAWGGEDGTYKDKIVITEVRLWLNLGGTSVTPTVTIGGTSATSDGTTIVKNSSAGSDWTKATKVTFTPAANGNTGVVVINVATVKAGYICAMEIDCEEAGGGPSQPTVSFSPEGGKYSTTQSVTLTSSVEGATIYYTTDGTDPSTASSQYSNAISVSETTTIKAFAEKDDNAGSITSATYTFPYTSIAALLSHVKTSEETHYVKMTNWIVTGVSGSQVYLTDGTEYGVLGYKSSHGFAAGNILNGTVDVKAKIYNQVPELTDLTSGTTGLTHTNGGIPTVYEKTIENLTINNLGIVVKLSNVTYNAIDGTLSDGENTVPVSNKLYSDLSLEDGKEYNITGVVGYTTDNNKTLQIYPRSENDIETVGGPVIVKTLENIAVTGMSTTYEVGDEFSFNGTCTATYSVTADEVQQDPEYKVVTPTSVSTPDMTTTGSKEITVTYTESEVSKTATYTITVNPKAQYAKVTTAPTDWSGEYLLVYENGSSAYVYTGVDQASNYASTTISNNKITKPNGAVSLVIASMEGGYSVKVNGGTNNGKYISGSTGSNTTNFTAEAVANTISITEGKALITANTTIYFNTANNNLRFRYFQNAQGDVQLYKKMKPTHTMTFSTTPDGAGSVVVSAGGTVIESNEYVEEGQEVTITPTANQYYQFKSIEILDGGAQEITPTLNQGVYSFTMPTSDVTAEVEFELIPVEVVNLNKTTLSLVEGDEETLSVTSVEPSTARATVSWTSANPNVATVDQNGKVKAIAAAEQPVTITATSTVTNNVYATCAVTVTAHTGHAITITSDHGTVSANEGVTIADVSAATEVILIAEAEDGYSVSEWTVAGVDDYSISEDKTTCSFTMPNDEVLIEVAYTHETATLKLHDAVGETTYDEGTTHYWKESVSLENVVGRECSKTFMGWSANPNCSTAVDMIEGTTYVLPNKGENIIYAVYADVEQVETWVEISEVPTAGTYAICSNAYFMKATVASNRFENGEAPSINAGKLTTAPAENSQWEITINDDGKFLLKNGTKYAAATGTKNQAGLNSEATDTKSQWTITYDEGFVVTNVYNSTNNVNAVLRNNSAYGWAAYAGETGSAPRFFKKTYVPGTASNYSTICAAVVVKPTITTQPTGATYTVNGTADAMTIVAEAGNGGALSYQWYSNDEESTANATAIVNATSAEYTPIITSEGTIYYYCVVTEANADETATSNIVAVVVNPAPVGEDYELFSGELEEGDYIVYYNGYALKNSVSSDRFENVSVTPENDIINTSDASIVWHVAASGAYWTLYNDAVEQYAAGTGVKNKAQLLADGTDDKALWTVDEQTGDNVGTYEFVNKANAAAEVNAKLRNNGNNGWACYSTSTGGALTLYKKAVPAAPYAVTFATCENGSVGATVETAITSGTDVLSGTIVTLTNVASENYRLVAYDVYKTDETSTKVTVTKNGNVSTFKMPAYDVTISATFEEIRNLTGITLSGDYKELFWQGTTFNTEGLVVTASFSNAADAVVTDEVEISQPSMSTYDVSQTITVSYIEGEITKQATYEIVVKSVPNTQTTPYTVAEVRSLYDAYDAEHITQPSDIYVQGVVTSASITGTQYNVWVKDEGASGAVTFEFYKMYKDANQTSFTNGEIVTGDIITAKGTLAKYGDTYEFAEGCVMINRIPFEGEKVDISNTKETAYTVARAIELIDDVTSDLTKTVFVKGVVTSVSGSNIFIKDAGTDGTTTFEFYNCENVTNVDVNDTIIGTGTMKLYNSTYEFNSGCSVVDIKDYIAHVTSVSLNETEKTLAVEETFQLIATIEPENASNQNVTWTSSNTNAVTVSESGLVTAVASGISTITVRTVDGNKTATCVISVTEESEQTENGSITFGNNNVKINAASVTADDVYDNEWTITTAGTTSFTQNAAYSQIGSSNNSATSITFTTTLPQSVQITKFAAKFGGFGSTAGDIALKVGEETVATGSLNATQDVLVSSTPRINGTVLTVTITNIAKGVKAYYISYEFKTVIASDSELGNLSYDNTTEFVVQEGATLTVNETATIGAVTVEKGGEVVVDNQMTAESIVVEDGGKVTLNENVNADVFQIAASKTANEGNSSGQVIIDVNNAKNLRVTGEAYFDYTLDPSGTASYGYYAFCVPFPVNSSTGIYTTSNVKLYDGVDYVLYSYHGDIRATGNYGWKRFNGTLTPGVFYLISLYADENNVCAHNTIRFKMEAQPGGYYCNGADATVDFSKYEASEGVDASNSGWNGVGNPTVQYVKSKSSSNYNSKMYVYNHGNNAFGFVTAGTHTFTVGSPFFIQAGATASMSFDDGSAATENILAPARVNGLEVENISVSFGNETYKDQLFVSASEDALNSYQITKDLAKMSMGTAKVAQISSSNYGIKLAVEYAPLVDNQATYQLNLFAPAAGTYSISAQQVEGADLYVTYEGAIVWNLSLGDYELDLTRGTTTGYGLLLVAQPNQMPTGVENGELLNGENGVQKILLNGQLYILRDGHLYDAVGKEMK